MLRHIAAFEFRYQIRSPALWVGCILFFLLTFGSVTVDQIQIGARGNVNVNSPFAILETLTILSIFAVFIVMAVVANVVIRDDDTGFAPIIRTTSISKYDYLVGRWLGATAAAFLVLLMMPLAIAVGSLMPWLDPEKIGPFRLGDYLEALFVFGLPTLLLLSALCFSLATATRSLTWSYIGAVLLVVGYIVMRALLRDPRFDTIASLADPFGRAAIGVATKYWTATERNAQLPAMTGLLLANRLLWAGIALAIFALTCVFFRFETRGARASALPASKDERAGESAAAILASPVHLAKVRDDSAARWAQAWALARVEMTAVFRSPAFFVLMAIGMLNSGAGLWFAGQIYGGDVFPVTRLMIDTLNAAFTIIPIIIALYYGGELVWRDRERRMHEIIDATAAPDWAHLVPKIVAITLVLAATFATASVATMLVQAAKGFTRFEVVHYLTWFVLPGTVVAAQLAVLSVFVQALVPHKFIGWLVMLVYLVASIALVGAGFEHNLYNYGGTSAVPLSDMNGTGHFWIGRAWFDLYWSAFAIVLSVLTYALWRRGAGVDLAPRLRQLQSRLRGGAAVLMTASLVIFVGLGGWIFYNTNVLNRYQTAPEQEKFLADYERTLLPYEKMAQPRIVAVALEVQLFPSLRRAVTNGRYTIENRTGAPLDHVHVRWARPLQLDSLQIADATLEKEYQDFDYRIYRLTTPLAPGERRTIEFKTTLEQRGFPNDRPFTRIVDNGTFIDSFEIGLLLGMSRDMLLTDRGKRRKYGLPPDLRPAKLEDDSARVNNVLRKDSDWIDADITVTTDADQTPVAPGTTVADTTENGRRTVHFRTDAPINHFFSIQSARYAIAKDHWRDADLAVYYHPAHEYNVQRMLEAMKVSLELFSTEFSPYQFKQARILEFPSYASFAQSFANTIPYSEAIGFIFNHKADPEMIDMVSYVTAHEIGHQWWGHQVVASDQQGATMLIESFAQYSALLVMERMYGREQIRKFLKYELDRYLRARGGEVVEELPLARVENQPYIHYQKGSLAMYWLKEVVGEEAVNASLRDLIAQYAFKAAPYPNTRDFLALLRKHAGAEQNPQVEQLIGDLFERITLYDAKAKDASVVRRADGRFDVTFTIEARKLYADGTGHETEAPLDEPFDVGVFAAEPGKRDFSAGSVLYFERRAVKTGTQTVQVTVDREPKFVGIDPFNKRIDRNSDDNVAPVTASAGKES